MGDFNVLNYHLIIFSTSTNQHVVLLTECLPIKHTLAERCASIMGNFQYLRR